MDQVTKRAPFGSKRIPKNIEWDALDSIATEARQNSRSNPETIGQASRISGGPTAETAFYTIYLEGK